MSRLIFSDKLISGIICDGVSFSVNPVSERGLRKYAAAHVEMHARDHVYPRQ